MLPFTEAQFLDVFAAYNRLAWPVLVAAWIATLVLLIQFVRGRAVTRVLALVTAAQWAWTGVLYHAAFFSGINRAAWLFSALFIAQAALLTWAVVSRRLTLEWHARPRQAIGLVLMAYALVYPALVLAAGFAWPRAPFFLVPCPLAIFTIGLLLTSSPAAPRVVLVVPVVWAVIGGSAAALFGVAPDWMLPVAGAVLAIDALRPHHRDDLGGRTRFVGAS